MLARINNGLLNVFMVNEAETLPFERNHLKVSNRGRDKLGVWD